jgi:hypothetical protein
LRLAADRGVPILIDDEHASRPAIHGAALAGNRHSSRGARPGSGQPPGHVLGPARRRRDRGELDGRRCEHCAVRNGHEYVASTAPPGSGNADRARGRRRDERAPRSGVGPTATGEHDGPGDDPRAGHERHDLCVQDHWRAVAHCHSLVAVTTYEPDYRGAGSSASEARSRAENAGSAWICRTMSEM